jgi:hypothetical protein
MDKEYITGGEAMIADELRVLFDEIKGEIMLVRNELLLLSNDVTKIREQLDNIEHNINNPQDQGGHGLVPGTPPPDERYYTEKL